MSVDPCRHVLTETSIDQRTTYDVVIPACQITSQSTEVAAPSRCERFACAWVLVHECTLEYPLCLLHPGIGPTVSCPGSSYAVLFTAPGQRFLVDENCFVFCCCGEERISISLLVERPYTFCLFVTILSGATQAGKNSNKEAVGSHPYQQYLAKSAHSSLPIVIGLKDVC